MQQCMPKRFPKATLLMFIANVKFCNIQGDSLVPTQPDIGKPNRMVLKPQQKQSPVAFI